MSLWFWSLLEATQTQPPSLTHTHTHTCISLYWLVGYKKGWGQQAYVWISFSLSLTHLSLSDSILCFPQQGAVLHPYISDSLPPSLPPPSTMCSFFLCVRLFALHLTYINQSVNPISFRAKPDGFAPEPPSRQSNSICAVITFQIRWCGYDRGFDSASFSVIAHEKKVQEEQENTYGRLPLSVCVRKIGS